MTILGVHLSAAFVALGAIIGMVYGVLAVGLILVHRASKIINFAHGYIGVLGGAFLGVAVVSWGVPYWVALPLAMTLSAVAAMASQVLIIRRLHGAPPAINV